MKTNEMKNMNLPANLYAEEIKYVHEFAKRRHIRSNANALAILILEHKQDRESKSEQEN